MSMDDTQAARFSAWYGHQRPAEEGMERQSWDDGFAAWCAALAAAPAPAGEPVAYLYQHEETGRTIAFPADARSQQPRWIEIPLYATPPAPAGTPSEDALREALTELRDRIKAHPAYADLTEAEEIETGGDTAELSYLARVADAALAAQEQKHG